MLKLSLIPAYSALPCPMFEILRNSVILFYLGLTSHIYVYVCVHVCELELHSLTGSLSLCLSVSLSQRSCHTCTFTHILLQAHTYTQSSLCQTTQSHTSHERYALFPPMSHLVITRSSAGPYTTPPVTLYFHTFISCKCSILSLCFPWTRHFPH